LVGDPYLSNPTPTDWFNVNAFATPAKYTLGNSGRNILQADDLIQVDLTLEKRFNITEKRQLEFRAEAFNVANRPTFAAPGASIGSASAPVVTTTLNANRIMQFALKLYF
jgi:hypothetical protein